MGRCMNRHVNGLMGGSMCGCKKRWLGGLMDGWTHGWMYCRDGWMDTWMDVL